MVLTKNSTLCYIKDLRKNASDIGVGLAIQALSRTGTFASQGSKGGMFPTEMFHLKLSYTNRIMSLTWAQLRRHSPGTGTSLSFPCQKSSWPSFALQQTPALPGAASWPWHSAPWLFTVIKGTQVWKLFGLSPGHVAAGTNYKNLQKTKPS